ncbi:hypothetical protein [Rhizobium rhizogenes]|nr:hypothetical protein [Rhizobium rhizogenes]
MCFLPLVTVAERSEELYSPAGRNDVTLIGVDFTALLEVKSI